MEHGFYVEVQPIILKYLKAGIHVYYFCGGRGIGKTYGALHMCRNLAESTIALDKSVEQEKFLYLRRTAVEAQAVSAPETSPFKKYNKAEGVNIYADYNNKLGFGNFYHNDKQVGYVAALSTFANLRGIDFSDISFILYDECIPESQNKRPLRREGYLFLDMLETINRNRIIEGAMEVVVCLLSNPIDLGSDLLAQLNLTGILNNMINNNQQKITLPQRSLHIEKFVNHNVSQKKSASMLYKFAADTGYNERTLSGDFSENDLELIQKKTKLTEYTPFLTLEQICVYQHKSDGTYYVCTIVNPSKYTFRAVEREKVRTVFYWLYKMLLIERRIYYDSYQTKVCFDQMIGYKPTLKD